MTLTRRGRTLLILAYILTALFIGWNLEALAYGFWYTLSDVLHTISYTFFEVTGITLPGYPDL